MANAASVNLGACVSYGYDSLKKNIGFHIVAVVFLAILNSVTMGILGGPILVGYYKALEKADAGNNPEIGDLFGSFDQFLPAFLVTLICGALIAIGYFLCIVPGLLIAPLLPAALVVLVQGETDAMAAIKRAWAGLQANLIMAALTALVLSIVASIGALACGVGVLFTIPIGLAGMYKLGQQIVGPKA